MIDNDQHIQLLEDFSTKNPSAPQKWNVFIKVDTGYHRAGLMTSSPALHNLVQKAEASPVVAIYGFYCHAGHSYKTRSSEEAAAVLQSEVDCVVQASSLLPADRDVVVSVGSTPAAHVVQLLKAALPSNVNLELHAGWHIASPPSMDSKLILYSRKLPLQRPPTGLNRPRHRIPTSPPSPHRSLQRVSRAE